MTPLRAALLLAAACAGLAPGARAQNPNQPAWDPAIPLPKFITHYVIDPQLLVAIAKYRSGEGHGYSDQYEFPDCSLKNYYQPLPEYLFARNGQNTLAEYAPASGTISSVSPDGPLSTGEPRGNQVDIVPDGYPQFTIVLFHVDTLAGIIAGAHVAAGDLLGYADLREGVAVDVAVSANWNATPMFVSPGVLPAPGQVLKPPGWRLLSPFDVMSDDAFALYAPYGLTDRSQMVIPLLYRNMHPGQFNNWDTANLDPTEFFIFPVAPIVLTQPQSVDLPEGASAVLRVAADATGTPSTFQWYRNGSLIPGATDMQYALYPAQASDTGFYSVRLTSAGGSTASVSAALTVEPRDGLGQIIPHASRLINLSTRAKLPVGGLLTAGFVFRGDAPLPLLLRAVGPGLGRLGVPGALATPRFDVIPAGLAAPLLSGAHWTETPALDAATAAVGAFPLVPGSLDCALTAALASGGYSLRIAAAGPADAGVALAEVYAADVSVPAAKLANVSTLGYSGTGAETMAVGFVLGGTGLHQVLIRAVGPGLIAFGVVAPMADPQLALVPQGIPTPALFNDNWGDNGQTSALQAAYTHCGAFPLAVGSTDAAMVVVLPPGAYTVQATDAGGGGGTVLVEVYDLEL